MELVAATHLRDPPFEPCHFAFLLASDTGAMLLLVATYDSDYRQNRQLLVSAKLAELHFIAKRMFESQNTMKPQSERSSGHTIVWSLLTGQHGA